MFPTLVSLPYKLSIWFIYFFAVVCFLWTLSFVKVIHVTMGLELTFATLRSLLGIQLMTTPFLPASFISSQMKFNRECMVVWMKVNPYIYIFENLVLSWWNYLRRTRWCSLISGGVSLIMGFETWKFMLFLWFSLPHAC